MAIIPLIVFSICSSPIVFIFSNVKKSILIEHVIFLTLQIDLDFGKDFYPLMNACVMYQDYHLVNQYHAPVEADR